MEDRGSKGDATLDPRSYASRLFHPLPPGKSGAADYNSELPPYLAKSAEISAPTSYRPKPIRKMPGLIGKTGSISTTRWANSTS